MSDSSSSILALAMPEKPTQQTRLIQLHLKDIFPLCDLSPSESDKDRIVNAAYTKLFEELIPGFDKGEVHFVLAEVLELDREESRPRILVYSNRDKDGVEELLNEYFKVIDSLRDDEWSISKADVLYTGSRIWCAETESTECQLPNEEKSWVIWVRELRRGYEFEDGVDEQKELEEINQAFEKYINALYTLHLKNYPFAYVMLIPIFLGSMYGKKRSRKKLGAIFLHFATTKRVDDQRALLRIYGRTLLFWHYYFTSEAVDKRQELLEESNRTKESLELSVALFNRIKPSIDEIRDRLQEMQKPLFALETEMNPARVIIFGEDLSAFFQVGPPIYILDGKQEITPKHDWTDGAVEIYKTLIAGVLTKVFRLEKEVTAFGANLWMQISGAIESKAEASQPLFKELVNIIPNLTSKEPNERQVKETFKIIKSWFSDAFKNETTPGLPISMLEFACRVWGCEFQKNDAPTKTFWVASVSPVKTIGALGILHEKHRLKAASINVEKSRGNNGKTLTSCTMKLTLGLNYREASSEANRGEPSLSRLQESLNESLEKKIVPGGDMTRFLWILSGRRNLTLTETTFNWKEGNCEFAIDFIDTSGNASEISIQWKGEINV